MNLVKRKKIEILEDAVVIYTNGERELVNAICINDKGIFTGHMINKNKFMEGGGIPKNSIKSIVGGKKRFVYKINS